MKDDDGTDDWCLILMNVDIHIDDVAKEMMF